MQTYLIKFTEHNIDGCGTNAEAVLNVKTDIHLEDPAIAKTFKEKAEAMIDQIKEELGEWDTDDIIAEICERIFGKNAEITAAIPAVEIEF